LATIALELADEAAAGDDYDSAKELASLGLAAARKAQDRKLVKQIVTHDKEIKDAAEAHAKVQAAFATLESNPTDPAANQAAGEYLCFVKGDWGKGIPMLALGNDEALNALAQQDLKGAASPNEQLELADRWWEQAESQENPRWSASMRGRAIAWYRTAIRGLEGLDKIKAQRRLEAAQASETMDVAGSGQELVHGESTSIIGAVDIENDRVFGDWSRNRRLLMATAKDWGAQGGQGTRIMMPVVIDGEYDLEVKFTRVSGPGSVGVILPVGGVECMVLLSAYGGKRSGINFIDGRDIKENPTRKEPGTLSNGRMYTLFISVRLKEQSTADISVLLQGKPYIHWSGKTSSLSLHRVWGVHEKRRPALGINFATVVFHDVRVRPISGAARLVRPLRTD